MRTDHPGVGSPRAGTARPSKYSIRWVTAGLALVSVGLATACSSAPAASTPAAGGATQTGFPRSQTLYTSGSAYTPPSNWNPLNLGNYATGTQGLVYEPLFLYDPIHGKYDPWLAVKGSWTGPRTYTISVRNGVTWSDGKPLTGADVAYSIGLARTDKADPYASNVASVTGVTARGNTVTVTFGQSPAYTAWQDYLWKAPVLPEHIWAKLPAADRVTAANVKPVGTGPMVLDTYNTSEVAYKDNTNWWAIRQLHLSFKFKYLVDLVNASNNVELSNLSLAQIDWSNNFLPGIVSGLNGSGGYGFKTYYHSSPYMLSANTVWLEPNTAKAPMNNANFRKALAYAINPAQIVSRVYSGETVAASPTGLLPNLRSYVNPGVVQRFGYHYDPALARQYLAKSGYHGQDITLEVPAPWTDWVQATNIISGELAAVGIKCTPSFPQAAARNADLTSGNYDLALDNNATLDASPWSYFQRVYTLPIQHEQTAQLNWERYSSPADASLVQQAGTTPLTDGARLHTIYSQLEKDFLTQLPEIPLWYNSAWFQANSKYWNDYPANGSGDENTPVMWGGYLGAMTSVYALAGLTPATAAKGS